MTAPAPDAGRTCPTCGAPARYMAIPHPEGEGTTVPLPPGTLGGKWYHDSVPLARPVAAPRAPSEELSSEGIQAALYAAQDGPPEASDVEQIQRIIRAYLAGAAPPPEPTKETP